MKYLRLIIVLVVLAIVGLFLFVKQSGGNAISKIPHIEQILKIDQKRIEKIAENATGEFSIIAERGKVLTEHAGKVLGSTVEEPEKEAKPLHERAFEYGRYVYCQEVVKEYEKSVEKTNTPDDARKN